ncbi:MAG: hypothetical protein EHM84_03230 [Lysobacterales bacterium]|nr:MAG: hypothetical protein EHM84_03230 [Xanthomonadales bacterium]
MNTPTPAPDFSLVLGGPLYQLWRGTRLAGDALQLLRRRIAVLTLLVWAPLLLLSVAEGGFWSGSVKLPFLHDVELHVRLLVALPLLIVAELVVNRRMRPMVGQFLERGLIPDAARAQFDSAIASAMRLRNSITAEVLLIALVYVVGVGFVWRTQLALDVSSWYGVGANGTLEPSLAGWWLGLVSLPVFQFLLLRWYYRIVLWTRFLWQVSRIELKVVPTHPDRCGGLGFLALIGHAFAPLLLAQGAVLAGMIASRIFFAGATLPEFKLELIGLVAVMVFAVLGPLLVFGPQLEAARRAGLREYGTLAQRYVRAFDQKWLRGGAPADEPLIGSADIQSLADLGNSFEVIKGMRLVPFTLQTVVQLAVVTLLPVLPLTLTMISLEELLGRLLKLAF